MNVFNKVTLQSLKKNKSRTMVTIIGIILSAAMICSVTTFASSLLNHGLQTAIYIEGDWHGYEPGTSFQTYEKLLSSDNVDEIAYLQQIGYARAEGSKNSEKPYIYLLGASNTVESMLPIHITDGKFPSAQNEILLPEHLYSSGGISYNIGDSITLPIGKRMYQGFSMGQHNPVYTYDNDGNKIDNGEVLEVVETRTFTVVGFYERPTFEDYSAPGFTALTIASDASNQAYNYDIYFKLENPQEIYDFVDSFDLTGNVNSDVLIYLGVSRHDNFQSTLYALAAIVIALIVFGSVALVYNAFSISVSERTRQFGLLSSVGATKRQLRKMIFFEAFAVSIIGIPIGIVTGIGGIGIALLFIGDRFAAMGSPVEMTLSVSTASVVIAIIISFITVLISVWVPSKRATSVSAVEAIRQVKDIKTNEKQVKTSQLTYKLFGFSGMLASKNYKRNKRKYRTTVISLFMSIVLFVSASAITDYLMESVAGGFGSSTYDISFKCDESDFENVSKSELLSDLIDDDAVTNGAFVVNREFEMDFDKEQLTDSALTYINSVSSDETNVGVARLDANICFVSDNAYKEMLKQHKLDESTFMDLDNPLAVVIDNSTYYDYSQKKYIALNILKNNSCEGKMLVEKQMDGYNFVGEVVDDNNGQKMYRYISFENGDIVDIPKEEAFEEVVVKSGVTIYEYPFFVEKSHGITFVFPESFRFVILPNDDVNRYRYHYMFTSDNYNASFEALKTTLTENGFEADDLYNYAASVESDRNLVLIIKVFSYGFIILISLIAAANVFNTISTNVNLRRREFAMLKSVGMTPKGFNRMMNFECLLYGSKSLLFGLPVSFGVTYLIWKAISRGYVTDFKLPWVAICIAIFSVFAVVFATMLYSMNKIKKDNPIDALKNENL